MTIIKLNHTRGYLSFVITLFVLVFLGGLVYIFEYNTLVSTRYELNSLQRKLVENEVQNTDLKNGLYKLLDPTNLEQVAHERGFILDRKPHYLTAQQWVSDSSY